MDANEAMHSLTEHIDDKVDAGTIGNILDLEIKTRQRGNVMSELRQTLNFIEILTSCMEREH